MMLQLLFKNLNFINVSGFFEEVNFRSGGLKRHDHQKILILSLVFLTQRNPPLSAGIFLARTNLKFLLDSEAQRREYI